MDLTSTEQMFQPQFATKVTMLTGYQDTFSMIGLMLKAKGEIENLPADFTNEDGDKIFAFLKPFVDDGFIRAFTGNEYIQDFPAGEHLGRARLLGRPGHVGRPGRLLRLPHRRPRRVDRQHAHPQGRRAQGRRRGDDRLRLRRRHRGPPGRLASSTSRRSTAPPRRSRRSTRSWPTNPLLFPPPDVVDRTYAYPAYDDEKNAYFEDLSAQLEGA